MEDSEPSSEPQKDEKKGTAEDEDNDRVGQAAVSYNSWKNVGDVLYNIFLVHTEGF